MEPRKSTPRNKVYPEGEGPVLTQRFSSRASSAAPADGGGEDVGLAALQLDARAKAEGRAAARSLLHFYVFKVLPPVGVVCVVLFALFAGLSYAVPRLLCHKFAVESSGAQFGMQECVYNSDGDYTKTSGAKVFWAVFWAVEYAWPGLFCLLIAVAMFGKAVLKRERIAAFVISSIPSLILLILGPAYHLEFNHYSLIIATIVTPIFVVIVCSISAGRYTNNRLNSARWFVLFMVASWVILFYTFAMPMLITARANDAVGGMGLTIFRLFIHPVIWQAVMLLFRQFLRNVGHIPDMMHCCFMMYPMFYSSLFGRFLLLQLDSTGNIIVINFMFACLEVVGRLGDRAADGYWLKFMYGERGRDAFTALKVLDEMRLVEIVTSSMAQNAGILAASALLSFGNVASAPGVPPDHGLIWYNAGAQLATTLFSDFVSLCLESKYHSFEFAGCYTKSIKRFLAFVLVVVLLGGARLCVDLLLLFCPREYDGTGVLLEQCDKPSVFQAINFAFALRHENSLVGNYLSVDLTNTTRVNA